MNEIAVAWIRDLFLPQINKIRQNGESRAMLLIIDGNTIQIRYLITSNWFITLYTDYCWAAQIH